MRLINMKTFDNHYNPMIEILQALRLGISCEFRERGSMKWMECTAGQDPNFDEYEYRIRTKTKQKFRVAQMYDSKRVRYLKFFHNDFAANNTEKVSPNFICWVTDWITYDE
jgi:hypothetical protein